MKSPAGHKKLHWLSIVAVFQAQLFVERMCGFDAFPVDLDAEAG